MWAQPPKNMEHEIETKTELTDVRYGLQVEFDDVCLAGGELGQVGSIDIVVTYPVGSNVAVAEVKSSYVRLTNAIMGHLKITKYLL